MFLLSLLFKYFILCELVRYKFVLSSTINSVIQVKDGIQIIGNGFLATDLNVKINVDITTSCTYSNSSFISCTALPTDVTSGYLVVTDSSSSSNDYQLYFTPYIGSISVNPINTAGAPISIRGRFFEQTDPITGLSNNIMVSMDSSIQIAISSIQSTSLLVQIPGGFGSSHGLTVTLSNNDGSDIRTSNTFNFRYTPPSFLSLLQYDEYFTMIANYYSTTDRNLNKVYCNDFPPVTPDISNSTYLNFTLQASCLDGYLNFQVADQVQNIQYKYGPVIKSISPAKPYVDNSTTITINGYFLSGNNFAFPSSSSSMLFQYYLDSSPTTLVNLTCYNNLASSVECDGFKGSGSGKIIATKNIGIGTKVSNILSFTFQEPIVIDSTSLFYQQPGKVTINVESFDPTNIQVFISDVECTNPVALDNSNIQCDYDASVPPNSNGIALQVKVISNSLIGSKDIFFYNDEIECPNNCTSEINGICDKLNGECICNSEWSTIDCSVKKQKPLPPPVINDNGETILSGVNLNFTVSIAYLRELDVNGIQVKTISMDSINWVNKTIVNENETYYKGTFNNSESVVVELDAKYFNNSQNFNFAGDIIYIPDNSIKYVITISRWSFKSPLNTLQVIYNSKTKLYYDDGCNIFETSSNSSTYTNASINWFQIVSANTVMDAKFSRRIITDDTVRKSSVSILSDQDPLYSLVNSSSFNKLVSINVPFFSNAAVLDPSFNTLIRPSDGGGSCESKSKWKTILISVLCSVVGVSIIVGIVYYGYSKYKQKQFLTNYNKKMNQINK